MDNLRLWQMKSQRFLMYRIIKCNLELVQLILAYITQHHIVDNLVKIAL